MCGDLLFALPQTEQELDSAAQEFQILSTNLVVNGCVGCLDGFLLKNQTPSSKESGNIKSYFSGHYQCYGIHVQSVCDSKCQFTSVSVVAPGGSNDIAAFRKTSLQQTINQLPMGKYIVGDNAYICTETLLTPFAGAEQQKNRVKDTYNFYLSQLRIRIEMSFGLLTNKWRILRRPLQVKLKNAGKVFMCLCRLYNFCIDENLLDGGRDSSSANMPDDDDNDNNDNGTPGFLPSDIAVINTPGNSMMRDILVDKIATMALRRPQYNQQRNNIRAAV